MFSEQLSGMETWTTGLGTSLWHVVFLNNASLMLWTSQVVKLSHSTAGEYTVLLLYLLSIFVASIPLDSEVQDGRTSGSDPSYRCDFISSSIPFHKQLFVFLYSNTFFSAHTLLNFVIFLSPRTNGFSNSTSLRMEKVNVVEFRLSSSKRSWNWFSLP